MEADAGTLRLSIFQNQLSMVIFHDLLDDGQTKSGALEVGGDVRLRQPLTSFLGEAAS